MTKMQSSSDTKSQLRQRAEEKLAKMDSTALSEGDREKQLHELMIHQIELEMQNEELARLRFEANDALAHYTNLYDFAPIPYMTLGTDGLIIKANNAAAKMFEENADMLLKKRLGVFVADEYKPVFNKFIDKAFNKNKHAVCEVLLIINDCLYWYILTAIANNSEDSILIAAQDISKLKADEELKLKQANYDYVTGLPNRRLFEDRLHNVIIKSQRRKHKFALLCLDIDHFKEINDTLGHHQGDEVLQQVAARLKRCVRSADTFARSGGDEFHIIVEELDNFDHIERVTTSILKAMSIPFKLGAQSRLLSISIGISTFPDDGVDEHELMKKADQALYEAKQQGRNRRCYFTAKMQERIQKNAEIFDAVLAGIKNELFTIEYQPIVALNTGDIHSAEVLASWQNPEHKSISPSDFYRVAVESGQIEMIDNWVFQQVAEPLKKWQTQYNKNFQLSLKITFTHRQKFNTKNQLWLYHLDTVSSDIENIIIAVDEASLISYQDFFQEQILKLKQHNIAIALDEFGSGLSSLMILIKIGIDYFIIDRNIVANIKSNNDAFTFCKGIIAMAHEFGIKVIADGIETKEQYKLLQKAKCDLGQGNFLSKPLPQDIFEHLLKKGLPPPLIGI